MDNTTFFQVVSLIELLVILAMVFRRDGRIPVELAHELIAAARPQVEKSETKLDDFLLDLADKLTKTVEEKQAVIDTEAPTVTIEKKDG